MAYELEQTAALLWPYWGFREWIIVARVVVRTRSRGWPVDRNVHRQRRLASSAIVGCTLVAIGVFIRVWYYRMLRPCPASAVDERRSNNSFIWHPQGIDIRVSRGVLFMDDLLVAIYGHLVCRSDSGQVYLGG